MTVVLGPDALKPQRTHSIEQVRAVCSIGAGHSANAIPRVIPITHCGPGCADKQYMNLAFYNGFQGGAYGGGAAVPSSNLTEREVVFGGADRLSELIGATLKVMDADLFVVLTGCVPDLVGDDVPAAVGDYQKQGVPIVYAETGGFRGNNFTGHEIVTRAIIDQYVGAYDGPRQPGLVNLWTLLPYHNPFWRGDLLELKRLLEGIGLKVNLLFGPQSGGVAEWQTVPQAQFNLVLSPWLGLATARHLEKKYGQPFLHLPAIPIGAAESARFLRQVAEFAGLDPAPVDAFITAEETFYYSYLESFTDFFAEYRWGLPTRFAVAADSAYALALTRFLVNQLGLIPTRTLITENPPEEHHEAIRTAFRAVADDVSVEIEFIEDSYFIHEALRQTPIKAKPPILFGTTWERDLAKQLKAPLIEVSFPASYEVVLNRGYVGYRGALTLLEQIYTTAVRGSA